MYIIYILIFHLFWEKKIWDGKIFNAKKHAKQCHASLFRWQVRLESKIRSLFQIVSTQHWLSNKFLFEYICIFEFKTFMCESELELLWAWNDVEKGQHE
jgi:hypothetical protein